MTKLGDRYNEGKPKLSLILEARAALTGLARILERGMQKYSRGNWRRGLVQTEVADSALRHLTAYLAGEELCPESGQPHVDHFLCNALFLSEMYHTRPDLDDRVKLDDPTPFDQPPKVKRRGR